MGQAKLRGDKDQRIVQAIGDQAEKERRRLMEDAVINVPTPGLYISHKTGARFVIEDVSEPEANEDLDTDGFFYVELIEEDGVGDMEAMGYEFDADEWREFAMLHGLFKA